MDVASIDIHRHCVYICQAMNAKEFRAALKAQGLSQRAFGREMGISARGVNRWARGVYPVPKWVGVYLELRGKSKGRKK